MRGPSACEEFRVGRHSNEPKSTKFCRTNPLHLSFRMNHQEEQQDGCCLSSRCLQLALVNASRSPGPAARVSDFAPINIQFALSCSEINNRGTPGTKYA